MGVPPPADSPPHPLSRAMIRADAAIRSDRPDERCRIALFSPDAATASTLALLP
jgi:hypothetical protein